MLNETTDLYAGYAYSGADYAQNNFATGLPLGINYQRQGVQVGLTHRFNPRVTAKLQYRFDDYNEPSSGGAANYRANSIFAVVSFRMW